MSWTIIVASSQADQLEELFSAAQEIARHTSPPGIVREATSVEEVLQKRGRSSESEMQLLIAAASLPNRQSSPDPRSEPGLDLIKALGREAGPPACILVSDRLEHYLAVKAMSRCELLLVDPSTNYIEDCLQLACKLGVFSAEPVSVPRNSQARAQEPANDGVEISFVASPSIANSPVPDAIPGLIIEEPGKPSQPSAVATYALLEVELPRNARSAAVSVEIHKPECIKRSRPEPLSLRQSAVDELIKDSQELKDRLSRAWADRERWQRYHGRWQAEYRKLSEGVGKLLWSSTQFRDFYNIGQGEAEGNIRLRFTLEAPLFDGLWEAIYDALGERFLMLDKTITRRALERGVLNTFANGAGGSNPSPSEIDAGDGTLSMLVIKSNVADGSVPEGPDDLLWTQYWGSLRATLPQLSHLEEEAKVLAELQRARTAGGNGSVARINVDVLPLEIPRAGEQWSLMDLVKDRLRDHHYDIVHFAGHALFAPSANTGDGRGYLIFSGYPKPRAVPIAAVATWLAKAGVQLVYLSCCRSSAAPAALEFARNKIPMTIGFHWDLEDGKAVDFAKNFYGELLEAGLKVCPAFREARRRLYQEHEGGDPIWACPVLVAQPADWLQVEGVLRPPSRHRRAAPRLRQAPPTPTPRRMQAVVARQAALPHP
jgi:hypothetical protein